MGGGCDSEMSTAFLLDYKGVSPLSADRRVRIYGRPSGNNHATPRKTGGNNLESAPKPLARSLRREAPRGASAPVPGVVWREPTVPMSSESFQRRVEILRESWAERRYLKELASSHEYAPQFRLLESLHRLAAAAVADIRAAYDGEIDVTLSPLPQRDAGSPAFSITVGGQYTVTFHLAERRRMALSHWFVSVTISSGGPGGAITAAGPERRNGQWTRLRVEDTLLSVLGAYERGISESRANPNSLRARGA